MLKLQIKLSNKNVDITDYTGQDATVKSGSLDLDIQFTVEDGSVKMDIAVSQITLDYEYSHEGETEKNLSQINSKGVNSIENRVKFNEDGYLDIKFIEVQVDSRSIILT